MASESRAENEGDLYGSREAVALSGPVVSPAEVNLTAESSFDLKKFK